MTKQLEEIKQWLMTFAHCVRNLDFESGRAMFYKDAYCFGSNADILTGVDDLIERQWKKIWPNISGFQFLTDHLHCELNHEGNFACVIVPWISTGYFENGTPYHRPGRVSIFLIHDKNTKSWLAKHTHYSLYPGTPTKTFKPPHA